ncbi:hypothetical protein EYF80_064290 [Liparis tanakae]|uniref:Uncharacterized protein n=1 Tax=Liparis tanakae TaxID=230148 RepID=A0A4Z2E9T7_9TELE|nr:hypothetical protein EYF80_064290 [Liparis tanakae]
MRMSWPANNAAPPR